MITEINIKNFKSIVDLTLPLSNLNVFIGENGCGKSNILEAIGFASAAAKSGVDPSTLHSKGIRSAKPSLIFNSFIGKKQSDSVFIGFEFDNDGYTFEITSYEANGVFPKWIVKTSEKPMIVSNWKQAKPEKADEYLKKLLDIQNYLIYSPNITALRGLTNESLVEPLGINGENLDVLISTFSNGDLIELKDYSKLVDWIDDFLIDQKDELKFEGYKIGRSKSRLFFKDKYMMRQNNIFSAENANEGILHIMFYTALFVSNLTPKFFAIDNIENGLNPKLCRSLMKKVAELAVLKNKQTFITTHNPAVLDGLNLHDDRQRLFVVKRNDEGHTQIERVKVKPSTNGENVKLSEMWMRGYLGAIPNNFF